MLIMFMPIGSPRILINKLAQNEEDEAEQNQGNSIQDQF